MILFAPMEGLTDSTFRRVHHECFSGVEQYFTPFLSPTQTMKVTPREKKQFFPEYTAGVPTVPQILAKDAKLFLWLANIMAELGYTEVNLNAGCPSGTVTAKQKGSGMLRDPDHLAAFLDEVCAGSPIPVSVKTRIGFRSADEWETLLAVYRQYPLKRLIIHPRTCTERYDPGTVHVPQFEMALADAPWPVVYNGDIFSSEIAKQAQVCWPRVSQWMIGRALVADPSMARQLNGGEPATREELVHFHDRLLQEYSAIYPEQHVHTKMRIVMKHVACSFDETGRLEKDIRKSKNLDELLMADRRLFEACPLKKIRDYHPD